MLISVPNSLGSPNRVSDFKAQVGMGQNGEVCLIIDLGGEVVTLPFTPTQANTLAGLLIQGSQMGMIPKVVSGTS